MAGLTIGTPNGTTGNFTINSDGFDEIHNLGQEKSFIAPAQRDIFGRGGKKHGIIETPRQPFNLLPTGNARANAKPEFTPLLKSVAKTNISRRMSAKRRGPSTTPGLPVHEESSIGVGHDSSLVSRYEPTPMPNHISSSVNSTPLAVLPTKDNVVLANDGNVMTLREQENIIDKIEKENFGLKMKIHFLEENLSKRGSEFNQAAVRENAELKVSRITMQRELHKFKKTIAHAEREAEEYRRQLEEYRDRIRRKQVDESVRTELQTLKTELDEKHEEVLQLQSKYESVRRNNTSEAEKLRDEVQDLQADLRERERQLEEREDEIDNLKSKSKEGSNNAAELQDRLQDLEEQMKSLQDELDTAQEDVNQAERDKQLAEQTQKQAEHDLAELQDEMANKSFTTKGLSRQLEEKANKFEDDYHDLRRQHQELQHQLEQKTQSEKVLQERLKVVEKEGSSDLRHLQQELDSLQSQKDTFERKYNKTGEQYEALQRETNTIREEKDLLHSRHDALTTESRQVQSDLSKAQQVITDLKSSIEQHKRGYAQNDTSLRSQHKDDFEKMRIQIDTLHQEAASVDEQHANELENWLSEKQNLESAKNRAEEKVVGLQRTIDKLQNTQGTLSSKETKLQEVLQSETKRHEREKQLLQRQIEEINANLADKQSGSQALRLELNAAKDGLRTSKREEGLLKQKVADLEDEIEVLQGDYEQEHNLALELQQNASSNSDAQVGKLRDEKHELQQKLLSLQQDLTKSRQATEQAEADKDDLEAKLAQRPQIDDTFDNIAAEKRQLKQEKTRLQQELDQSKQEQQNLRQQNRDLEEELDAEIERAAIEEQRLQAELASLQCKQSNTNDLRDKERELKSARNQIARLEKKISELEQLLENQPLHVDSPGTDISGLRADLDNARKAESNAAKKEQELRNSNRDLKMKVHDLERDLHVARLNELKARSPASSISSQNGRELNELRQEVFDARAQLKVLQDEKRSLKHTKQPTQDNTALVVIQAQLESKDDQINSLDAQLRQHNDLMDTLRKDIARIRQERDEARRGARRLQQENTSTIQLRAERDQLRSERDQARDNSLRLAGTPRMKEAFAIKSELVHLRKDKTVANKRAEQVEKELDVVQARYEILLEQIMTMRSQKENTVQDLDSVRSQKEIRGLMKEVLWLKAKCRREERLRRDLAWSKSYLENNEAMRVKCNSIDLRILREMGVEIDAKKYDQSLRPIQKLRAGVHVVLAGIRLRKMGRQWAEAQALGEEISMKRKKIDRSDSEKWRKD